MSTDVSSASSARSVWTEKDWVSATLLMVATTFFVLAHIHRPILPMEDASMLLRYSQNVARGHGIVWNVGEHPVEGATDFLYMLVIGVLSRLTGAGVKAVATGLLLLSHVASVGVLYGALRKLYEAPMLLAGGLAALLGAGLGYHYVDMAFSAPFYGLFALLTWCVGMVCVQDGVTWRRAIGFGALEFVTGLIRPDGVILAGLMLCSAVFGVRGGWAERRRLIVSFGVIFAVLGGVYFGWRLHYFGYPFPNPYYIKHSGLHFAILKLSARGMVEMLLPVLPLAALGLRSRAAFREMSVWLITVVPFTAVWMMISSDNNHFSRFQYVMIPLSLLAIGGIAAGWWRETEADGMIAPGVPWSDGLQVPLGAMLVGLCVCGIYYDMHLHLASFSNRGAQDVAARLKPYAAKNYTMVVTEAGDLPFYSEWRAIDAFGLNDAFVAHSKDHLLTDAYLDSYRPEILLYRVWGDFVDVGRFQAQLGAQYENAGYQAGDFLTNNDVLLDRYARRHGYVLAAIWGARLCQADVYWVRADFADSDAIVSAIRDHAYYTQAEGQLATDFRGADGRAAMPTAACLTR